MVGNGDSRKNYDVILDREEAIEFAIKNAKAGDIIMILSKGHETTQTLKDKTIDFNDYQIAEEKLNSIIN